MTDAVARAAEILIGCHRSGGRAADLPDLSESEAYSVQAATTSGLDASVGGWKVAIVGGRPVAAPLLRHLLLTSRASLALQDNRDFKVETELAFTLARDLPVGPIARDELIGAIATVHAAFEVVGARVSEPPLTPFHAFLADNLGNAATVVSTGQTLRACPGQGKLYGDGRLLAEGHHPHDDPLAALLAYAAMQPDALGGLRSGQLIITGSFTGVTPVNAPGHFKGEFDGLAPVELTLIERGRL